MYGVFCRRVGFGRTIFCVLDAYEHSGSFFQFGGRTVSSGVGGGRQLNEQQSIDIEACRAYLEQSWGLCPKIAENVSRQTNVSRSWRSLKLDRADAVLQSLKDHGFDHTHVAKIVKNRPGIIFADAEKLVVPKLGFFSSIGIPSEDLARMVASNPSLLWMSLEKSLMPRLEFLKTLLVDNDDIIKVMKSNSWIFLVHGERNLAPNLITLREAGVPQHFVRRMMKRNSLVVTQNREKFSKCLEEVTKMGFHPKESSFLDAMHVFSGIHEANRDRKIDILRRYGMSESEIQITFKKKPRFMVQSAEKLMSKMEFLVKDMRWTPSDIAGYPRCLEYSLENRLMPRCSVIRLLQFEGLLEKDLRLSTFVNFKDEVFYDKFLVDYLDKIPQLLDVYQGKMSHLVLLGTKQHEC